MKKKLLTLCLLSSLTLVGCRRTPVEPSPSKPTTPTHSVTPTEPIPSVEPTNPEVKTSYEEFHKAAEKAYSLDMPYHSAYVEMGKNETGASPYTESFRAALVNGVWTEYDDTINSRMYASLLNNFAYLVPSPEEYQKSLSGFSVEVGYFINPGTGELRHTIQAYQQTEEYTNNAVGEIRFNKYGLVENYYTITQSKSSAINYDFEISLAVKYSQDVLPDYDPTQPTPTLPPQPVTPTVGPVSPSPTEVIPTASWTDEELDLIDAYAYGFDIPTPQFRDNNYLEYDEDYGELTLVVPNVTLDQVNAYAEEFDSSIWEGEFDDEDGLYAFYVELEFEGQERSLQVVFGLGVDEEDENYPLIEEGAFTLSIYDPFIYEWPTDLIDDFFAYCEIETSTEVPVFEADKYEISTTFVSWGVLIIYAYTDSATAEKDYRLALEEAGFTVASEVDDYGYYVATSEDGLVEIDFAYDPSYQDLDIMIYALDNGGGEDPTPTGEEGDEVLNEVMLAVANQIFGEEEGSSSYYYDSDYECYFASFETEFTELEDAAKVIAEELLPLFEEAELVKDAEFIDYGDGTTGYNSIIAVNENIAVDAYDWEEEGVIWVEIDVYYDDTLGTTGGEGTGEIIDNGEFVTVNLDLTTMADQAEFTGQTVGEVTFACSMGVGSNQAKYFANGNALRIYWGNEFTFSVSEGYEIQSIELVSSGETGDKILDFSVFNWTNGNAEVLENVCRVTPIDGTSDVIFNVGATKGNIRLTSISVTYVAVE